MFDLQTLMLESLGDKLSRSALVVTGGSSGMGKAVLEVLKLVYSVCLNLDLACDVDVTNKSQVKMSFELLDSENLEELYVFSNVGLEVFCRADGSPVNFLDDDYDIKHTVDANLISHLNVIRESVNFAKRKKLKKLNIILNSSIAAYCIGGVTFAAYCAAKAGVSNIPSNLATLSLQQGFTFDFIINAIEPGSVRTNVGTKDLQGNYCSAGADFVTRSQDADKALLGGREVSMDNIVNTVMYLFFANHAHRGNTFPIDFGLTKTTGARDLSPEE